MPLVCLVINSPQNPLQRVTQQRQSSSKKPKPKKPKLQPSSAFLTETREQMGLAPLLTAPPPLHSTGLCCTPTPPRKLMSISHRFRTITLTRWSFWQQRNPQESKGNGATLQLQAIHKYSDGFSLLRWAQEEYPSLPHPKLRCMHIKMPHKGQTDFLSTKQTLF